MTVAIVAGLFLGGGFWIAWTGLRPAPESLGAALERFDRRPTAARRTSEDASQDRDLRLGSFLIRAIPPLARALESSRADLRIVGRTPEEQAARVGAFMLLPLMLGPWLSLVAWVAGVNLPPILPGLVCLGGAGVGMVLPFLVLRAEANERRKSFAYALSGWCDIVVMNLASGRGVEQSMETAAAAGNGWPFAELRGALRAGYVRGEPPWEALTHLGEQLRINDLAELASTVAMAGEEGAAVRETVAAKAQTIRQRITADNESEAAAKTERMTLPTVFLAIGFLIFLGYPALAAIFGF
ncbi:MAG: type II secretion system F family protein [Candidatus Rokuibacteriota bacterium]